MKKYFIQLSFTLCLSFALLSPVRGETKTTLSACGLFTKADAESLLNEHVSEGVSRKSTMPAGEACRYTFTKKGGSSGITIRVSTTPSIKEEGLHNSAKDLVEKQKKARGGSDHASKLFKAVHGLGDDAFWSGNQLWVLKGETLLMIKVNVSVQGSFKSREAMDAAVAENNLALSRKIAATALTRLK